MISKTFIIEKKNWEHKFYRTFTNKLKILAKCYSVRDFLIDEEKQKFQFKASFKIGGIKMDYPKIYKGEYEIDRVGRNRDVKLKLKLNI